MYSTKTSNYLKKRLFINICNFIQWFHLLSCDHEKPDKFISKSLLQIIWMNSLNVCLSSVRSFNFWECQELLRNVQRLKKKKEKEKNRTPKFIPIEIILEK